MDNSAFFLMAVIQGISESLPISSSAHVMLASMIMSLPDTNLIQDIAIQSGSTLAFIAYFRLIILRMIRDFFRVGFSRQQTEDSRLAWFIILGTVPVGLSGLIFHDLISDHLHAAWVIGLTAIVFGLLMGIVDKYAPQERLLHTISLKDALIIGCIQVFALIPGASRSGVTMTAGRALGLTRQTAAQFSFLLSIPVSTLAVLFQIKEATELKPVIDWSVFITGVLISGLLSYAVISLLMRWIDRIGLMPFAIYRILLGFTIFTGMVYLR